MAIKERTHLIKKIYPHLDPIPFANPHYVTFAAQEQTLYNSLLPSDMHQFETSFDDNDDDYDEDADEDEDEDEEEDEEIELLFQEIQAKYAATFGTIDSAYILSNSDPIFTTTTPYKPPQLPEETFKWNGDVDDETMDPTSMDPTSMDPTSMDDTIEVDLVEIETCI